MQLQLLIACIIVAVGLLSGCTNSNIHTISYESTYMIILDNSMISGTLNIELKVLEGGNVDLFLMDKSGYDNYSDVFRFTYYPDGSELNTTYTKKSLPIHRGEWYIIVDNTYIPMNGAEPDEDVKVELNVWCY